MQRDPVDHNTIVGVHNGVLLALPLWAGVGWLAVHALRAIR